MRFRNPQCRTIASDEIHCLNGRFRNGQTELQAALRLPAAARHPLTIFSVPLLPEGLFERINNIGTKLDIVDLMTART